MPSDRSSSIISSIEKRRSGARSSVSCTGQAQAIKAQPRILPRRQHHPQRRRQPAQKHLKPAQRIGRPQLMQIVDHQHRRLLQAGKVGQELIDHSPAAERRRRSRPAAPGGPRRRARRSPRARTAARRAHRARPTPIPPGPAGPAASIQERSNIVLPLPAGAHTSTTPPPSGADRRSNSASRRTSRCAAASGCGVPRRVSRPPSMGLAMSHRVRAPREASHKRGAVAVRRNPRTEPPHPTSFPKGASRDDAARRRGPSISAVRGAQRRFQRATPDAGLRVVDPPLGQAFRNAAQARPHFSCHAPRPIMRSGCP